MICFVDGDVISVLECYLILFLKIVSGDVSLGKYDLLQYFYNFVYFILVEFVFLKF